MGLDSVELLMEIENYFGIRIPDSEAEKIYTVQMMVNSVAAHLNIENDGRDLRDKILERINVSFLESAWTTKKMIPDELIADYIPPGNKKIWTELKSSLKLSVPEIQITRQRSNKISDKLKRLISWKPAYEWNRISVEKFVDAVCANNYVELIDKKNIQNKYEIYIVVVGLTVNKTGVDYYEVAPEKSFTTDLGVD